MDSDVSTQTMFNTISNFDDSFFETPDKFIDSEPSRTNFSQPPYLLITPHIPDEPCSSRSSRTDATRILYPLLSNEPDASNPITNDQFEHDLDKFTTNQQKIHDTNNLLTIHQLTHSASTSESFNP